MSSIKETIGRITPGPAAVLLLSAVLVVWLLYMSESRLREANTLLQHQNRQMTRLLRHAQPTEEQLAETARRVREAESDELDELAVQGSSNDGDFEVDVAEATDEDVEESVPEDLDEEADELAAEMEEAIEESAEAEEGNA